jgi:hypothetical protein
LHPKQGRLGTPGFRPESGQLELHWEVFTGTIDVGVHPAGKSLQYSASLWVVAGKLLIGPGTSIAKKASQSIVGKRFRAKDLRQSALSGPSVHLHLPQTVLGLDETLSEKEVVQVSSIDMGNSPGVAENIYLPPEPGEADFAIDLGKVGQGQLLKVGRFLDPPPLPTLAAE